MAIFDRGRHAARPPTHPHPWATADADRATADALRADTDADRAGVAPEAVAEADASADDDAYGDDDRGRSVREVVKELIPWASAVFCVVVVGLMIWTVVEWNRALDEPPDPGPSREQCMSAPTDPC